MIAIASRYASTLSLLFDSLRDLSYQFTSRGHYPISAYLSWVPFARMWPYRSRKDRHIRWRPTDDPDVRVFTDFCDEYRPEFDRTIWKLERNLYSMIRIKNARDDCSALQRFFAAQSSDCS